MDIWADFAVDQPDNPVLHDICEGSWLHRPSAIVCSNSICLKHSDCTKRQFEFGKLMSDNTITQGVILIGSLQSTEAKDLCVE